MAPEDLAGYREVKAAPAIPVAGGECEFTRWLPRVLAARRSTSSSPTPAPPAACPSARRSPTWPPPSACATCRTCGAPASGSPPRCSCWPCCRTRRALAPLEPMLEFDRTEHPFRQAILTRPIEHEGGMVRVPEGPGLGIEVDREALARFAVRSGS